MPREGYDANAEICPICDRPMIPGPSVDEHHLVPRCFKGVATVRIHRICHGKIHAVFSAKDLHDHYHTIERLRDHPEIAKFRRWVRRKHPEFTDGHARRRGKRR